LLLSGQVQIFLGADPIVSEMGSAAVIAVRLAQFCLRPQRRHQLRF
jgi:hypothetical protein